MQIREHYINSFNQIRNKFGELPCNHLISENVSLKKAIGYTRQFIVESDQEHFRYDYYKRKIGEAITRLGLNPVENKITHLDLGCGPGLFSWVVRDCLRSRYKKNPDDIELIGYDYAENMIHLANLFHEYLPVEYNFDGYFEFERIRNMLKSRDFSDCDNIITFGHVLIQIKDNLEAQREFVEIIQNLFPVNSCILVAVDAYAYEDRRQDFRHACKTLLDALTGAGIDVKSKPIGSRGSTMYASLSR